MEKPTDQVIDQIIKRLDKIEADISILKTALSEMRPRPQSKVAEFTDASPPARPVLPPKPPKPPKPSGSLESDIGTKWIGRIGMVAIIFGAAFFLKYSFDNRLIGETGRIILGLVSGIAFIGLGEYFQSRRHWPVYGQILSGGGIAILYFSLYAAFAFYRVLTQPLAFGALFVVTTTGITLSVRYSAASIAALGLLGGFLTPLMLSTGENRPLVLFSYILLLDAGILAVAQLREWSFFSVLSLAGTIFIYVLWHSQFYTPEQQLIAFGVVTVFFFFYNLQALFGASGKARILSDQAIIMLSAAWYFLSVFAQYRFEYTWGFKAFSIALSAATLGLAALSKRSRHGDPGITAVFAAVSAVANVVAVFVILEKEWQSAALAAQMATFIFLGVRLSMPFFRIAGYLLAVAVIMQFLARSVLILGPFDSYTILLNRRFLICAFIIAMFYATSWIISRGRSVLSRDEGIFAPLSLIIAQVLSVFLLSLEISDFYASEPGAGNWLLFSGSYASQLALSILWAVYAMLLVAAGIFRRSLLLRILGMLLFGFTIAKVFFIDLSELRTIYRIVSFVCLGLILLGVSYAYNRFTGRIFGERRNV